MTLASTVPFSFIDKGLIGLSGWLTYVKTNCFKSLLALYIVSIAFCNGSISCWKNNSLVWLKLLFFQRNADEKFSQMISVNVQNQHPPISFQLKTMMWQSIQSLWPLGPAIPFYNRPSGLSELGSSECMVTHTMTRQYALCPSCRSPAHLPKFRIGTEHRFCDAEVRRSELESGSLTWNVIDGYTSCIYQ